LFGYPFVDSSAWNRVRTRLRTLSFYHFSQPEPGGIARQVFHVRIWHIVPLAEKEAVFPDLDTGARKGVVMQLQLIAALVIVFLIVTFAVQNAVEVSVIFLLWRADASLAVVIAVCFGLGALIGALVTLPTMLRERMAIGRLHKEVEALRAENDSLRALKQNEASVP
jgi:uncharacterized integral membrane protein